MTEENRGGEKGGIKSHEAQLAPIETLGDFSPARDRAPVEVKFTSYSGKPPEADGYDVYVSSDATEAQVLATVQLAGLARDMARRELLAREVFNAEGTALVGDA